MNWIKTTDKLPDFHVKVLFFAGDRDGIRLGALYRHSHKFVSGYDAFYKCDVSHWASIQAPQTEVIGATK